MFRFQTSSNKQKAVLAALAGVKHPKNTKPVIESLQEYGRGIAGGLLFSFPILYTMEVWWSGFIATPVALLILSLVTFILLLGYNRYAGMRADASWQEIVLDSMEEMGIGLVVSFTILLMLNRIQLAEMSVDEIMGKVVIEAMFVSIGVSIGTAQLGAEKGDAGNEKDEEKKKGTKFSYRESKTSIAILALCGSIIVGGNVAPTEEILVIAIEADPLHILMMALLSLLLSMIITTFIDFKGSFRKKPNNFVYHLIFDTSLCYVIALLASAFVLWFFGRFESMSFWNILSQIIVLGLLSSLGASAGRLLIK